MCQQLRLNIHTVCVYDVCIFVFIHYFFLSKAAKGEKGDRGDIGPPGRNGQDGRPGRDVSKHVTIHNINMCYQSHHTY